MTRTVRLSVGQYVCHNFLKWWEVTLPCSHRSTYQTNSMITLFLFLYIFHIIMCIEVAIQSLVGAQQILFKAFLLQISNVFLSNKMSDNRGKQTNYKPYIPKNKCNCNCTCTSTSAAGEN